MFQANKWAAAVAMAATTLSLMAGCATMGSGPSVRVVDRIEAVFTDKDGAVLAPVPLRAWIEDIERDAAAASLIFRASEDQTIHSMTVSPDSTTIAFSLIELAENQVETVNGVQSINSRYAATIRAISTSGGGVSQLTTGRWLDLRPQFGPPGFITFDSNRTRPDGRDLYRIASGRAGGVSVIRQTNDGFTYSASVANDDRVVFEFKPDYRGRGLMLGQTEPQIWSIGGSMGYPTQLREGSSPALSPDGEMVAFIGENGQLWTMTTGGSNPSQLTSTTLPKDRLSGELMPKRDPAWTPDGQGIVFAAADGKDSQQFSNYDIWIINRDGGSPRQLTTNGSADFHPMVDPNGAFVYFISNRGFVDGIWRLSMDGV